MFRSRLAIAHELIIVSINVCTDFELLKVKVPLKFLGTVGFSLRREGRYFGMSSYSETLKIPFVVCSSLVSPFVHAVQSLQTRKPNPVPFRHQNSSIVVPIFLNRAILTKSAPTVRSINPIPTDL
jgi:hypothetical protein